VAVWYGTLHRKAPEYSRENQTYHVLILEQGRQNRTVSIGQNKKVITGQQGKDKRYRRAGKGQDRKGIPRDKIVT
jgi:hypothetical protein